MATTKQQLDKQKALRDQQLALKEKQLNQNFELSQKGTNLTQEQLAQSYQLAQQNLKALEQEKQSQSSKLAQQAYISKQQAERVMPDVLAAQGLARTGYANTRKSQINQAYQGQYDEISDDLNLYLSGTARQRNEQNLNYNQNLAQLEYQKQQRLLALEQDKEAMALERQAYELDYRQALNNISAKGSGSGSSSANNLNQIYQFGALEVENKMSPNQVDAYVQQYIDAGYMSAKDKGTLVNNLKNYAYTFNTGINQFSIPTVTKPKQAQQTDSQKVKKALAVGQW